MQDHKTSDQPQIKGGAATRGDVWRRCAVIISVSSIMLVASASVLAQHESRLQERVRRAEAEAIRLSRDLKLFKADYSVRLGDLTKSNESLLIQVDVQNQKIDEMGRQLMTKIDLTERKSTEGLQSVDGTISKNTLILFIAGALVLLVSILFYVILHRRLAADKVGLINTIQRNRKELEEEGLKMDNKLVDLLATQMELQKQPIKDAPLPSGEVDHSLALKVADEIVRIEKNLGIMDPDIRGFKQLNAAVRRIRDSFAAKGYELVEMLNQRYDPGMKVIASFRPDETLGANEQIITRIIKPQVNFNGVMIQAAQIEVSQGD